MNHDNCSFKKLLQNDDEEQNGFSHIPHAEVEYPDTESSDDEYLSTYSSDSSTGSVISPLVSPITSEDNMTDSESESDVHCSYGVS